MSRKLTKADTAIAFGLSRKLEGGATAKASVTHAGILSTHFSKEISAGTTLAVSAQFDVKSIEKNAKLGATLTFKA